MDIISKDVLGKMVHEQYIVDDYVKMSNILIHIHMSVEFVGQVFHDSWLSNSQPYLLVNLYIVCDTKNHGIFPARDEQSVGHQRFYYAPA